MEVINNGQDMVVIVNGAESFIANGLKSKMNNAGINTIIVGRRIKDVEAYRSIAKLFILFMAVPCYFFFNHFHPHYFLFPLPSNMNAR